MSEDGDAYPAQGASPPDHSMMPHVGQRTARAAGPNVRLLQQGGEGAREQGEGRESIHAGTVGAGTVVRPSKQPPVDNLLPVARSRHNSPTG